MYCTCTCTLYICKCVCVCTSMCTSTCVCCIHVHLCVPVDRRFGSKGNCGRLDEACCNNIFLCIMENMER